MTRTRCSHNVGRWFIGLFLVCATVSAEPFDILLRGAQVMDGSGAPATRADIGIIADRIAAVGDLSQAQAGRVVDCNGLLIAPGIIDLHSHADGSGESGGLRARDPRRRAAPNLVSQGITTVVVNQDGRSPSNISRQIEQLTDHGFGPNAVVLAGHNTIRRMALQTSEKRRPATPEEIERMRGMVREAMDAGAWGLSAGLEYEPGIWSTTEELVALVEEVKPYRGVYIVHERASGIDPMWFVPSRHGDQTPTTMADNVREIIEIAESTGVTSVVTHIKARGVDYWGKSGELIELIQEARDRGVSIYADQYPYTTSGSDGTITLLPRWIVENFDGPKGDYRQALRKILADDETAEKLALDIVRQIGRRGGPNNILVIEHANPNYIGHSLGALARQLGITPVEMVYVLQLEGFADRLGGATLRGFSMDEQDIQAFAVQPWCATASDAGITLTGEGYIHPRYYGTFPRKIRKYVLTERLLSLEQAIHSMTGLPAEILNMKDRGRIAEGNYADLMVLDLDALRDKATIFRPHQFAAGVPHVLVNGEFVVDGGHRTLRLPGRVLTRDAAMDTNHTDD